ncbi:MAG: hypothetical protein K9L30_12190 [Desulfobacterales bacterium]|nr:hypothetical protein [Desulfobacterales bacterium]
MDIIKMICVLAAAIIIGNMFMSELKKTKAGGKPLYTAYLSLPGILIILAVLLPLALWIYTR